MIEMKKAFLIFYLCLAGCNIESTKQRKAENLVRNKLRDFNSNTDNLEIIKFSGLNATYTSYEDDINYDRYKVSPAKLDSLKKNYRPLLTAWVIYVKFRGYDEYGKFGTHLYQCAIDKKLAKVNVLIEIDGAPI